MKLSKTWMIVPLLALFTLSAWAQCGSCPMKKTESCPQDTAKTAVFQTLPGPGKKCWIGQDNYFTYKFDKKPKMGVVVLKIQLFDKDGKQDTAMEITGLSGMPSMGGAHDFEQAFKRNTRGDYLMPVNIVMPGEWEVKLTFAKDKKPVHHGAFKFKV